MLRRSIANSSLGTLAGLLVHFVAAKVFGLPLFTDAIAEWVMARTPSSQALWLLHTLGPWAKPFAATSGLATLGFLVWLCLVPAYAIRDEKRGVSLAAMLGVGCLVGVGVALSYTSTAGQLSFWLPALAVALRLRFRATSGPVPGRREFLATAGRLASPVAMVTGIAGVALESYLRNEAFARRAVEPISLFPYTLPRDDFGEGLVRPPVTPVGKFYTMSKNTVDPVLAPADWSLRVTVDGILNGEYSFETLLSLPRVDQYASLRCVSNNLKSNLMGTALWSGVRMEQLIDPARLPPTITEMAVIGADGHGDSLPLDYALSEAVLIAVGMNGKTLERRHGFPVRMVAPKYYGFKHVKWIAEIAFRTDPYFGTWPKMGYTKKPVIHTVSFIDRIEKRSGGLHVGGIAMSGHGGIRDVELRADDGPWAKAELERRLSPYTWTRWKGRLPQSDAEFVEARAMDARGVWQAATEGPLFPDGVEGPTIRRVS